MASFDCLPDELQISILLMCDIPGYRAMAQTCKQMNSLCRNDCFGKTHILQYALTHRSTIELRRWIDVAETVAFQVDKSILSHNTHCDRRTCTEYLYLIDRRSANLEYLHNHQIHLVLNVVRLAARTGSLSAVQCILTGLTKEYRNAALDVLARCYNDRFSRGFDVQGMFDVILELMLERELH